MTLHPDVVDALVELTGALRGLQIAPFGFQSSEAENSEARLRRARLALDAILKTKGPS